MTAFKDTMRMDQDHYPERPGDLFIINAPWLFSGLWPMIKVWLNEMTRKKFHICGSKYQQELLKFIPASQLPVEYGGTLVFDVPVKAEHVD